VIAILVRYLSPNDLIDKLKELVHTGISEGNLEVISLIGLRSPYVGYVLQKYVDKSGDIQTAAYIASYAFAIQHSSANIAQG
jgi:hypothetical protein